MFFYMLIFSSILLIISLFILLDSVLIKLIILSRLNTINSESSIAVTVAVLSSSFKSAISQKISQELSSDIFFHFIVTSTVHDFIIYHSQFEWLHSISIFSHHLNNY